MTRIPPAAGAALVLLALFMAPAISARTNNALAYTSTATHARIDPLEDGKIVVNLDVKGDLPGLLTLNLQQNADGTVTGDWALVVAYADPTDPATGEEPDHAETDGQPHKDFLRLVRRGTLGGSIRSASLLLNGEGGLADLTAALDVEKGSVEFEGALGSGTATLADLSLVF